MTARGTVFRFSPKCAPEYAVTLERGNEGNDRLILRQFKQDNNQAWDQTQEPGTPIGVAFVNHANNVNLAIQSPIQPGGPLRLALHNANEVTMRWTMTTEADHWHRIKPANTNSNCDICWTANRYDNTSYDGAIVECHVVNQCQDPEQLWHVTTFGH